MEPSPFSNTAVPQEGTEQPDDRGMVGNFLIYKYTLLC